MDCVTCVLIFARICTYRGNAKATTLPWDTIKETKCILSNIEILQKLKTIAKEKKTIERKLDPMSKVLGEELEKHGVVLNESTSASFRAVAENKCNCFGVPRGLTPKVVVGPTNGFVNTRCKLTPSILTLLYKSI